MQIEHSFSNGYVMTKALYLHIPFCARKCAYCDFSSWATPAGDPLMAAYARALEEQLTEAAALGLVEGCETAYVGGGTPTLLGEKNLGSLVSAVRSVAPGIAELSCEANPDSLTDGVIDALRAAGATRLSVGVQSLDDGELAELGRLHDAACARGRVAAAVASGLDVSVDLMCATPGQTDESWRRTLEGALALGVGHVSAYPLQIEEGTALDRRYADDPCPWNSDEVQAARMSEAQVMLEGSGLARYEVASYAAAGKRCRHNIAYWTGLSYLGLGTGASSMLNLKEYLRFREVAPQLPKPPEGTARARLTVTTGRRELAADPRLAALSASLEFLTEAQAATEDLMLGARLVDGLDPALVSRARDLLGARLNDALADLLSRGLLAEKNGRLAPTESGWLLGNELYGALWDLAPGEVLTASC
ncbi:coproporphyrinogen III oxidase family protein [Olsenella uli]|nr:coproporphyrinogen III oxidase family protein [Olsenella uli]